jgi:hypothetical protein
VPVQPIKPEKKEKKKTGPRATTEPPEKDKK